MNKYICIYLERRNNLGFRSRAFLLLLFLCISCEDFLKIDAPKSKVEHEVVFNDEVTATSAVLGVYSELLRSSSYANGANTSVLSLAGLSADEMDNYPDQDESSVQFEQNNLSADNQYILSLWTSLYQIIYQSNSIIEGLNGATQLGEETRFQLMGEMYFIRAFSHFYLVNLFGDVPLVLTTDYEENASMSRTPISIIYEQIVTDLLTAKQLLRQEYAAVSGERIRVNKAAAIALLARVYLYTGEWSMAEAEATDVINDVLYGLETNLDKVFLKNSKEAIWQLRPNINKDNGYTAEAYYFSPSNVLDYNVLRQDAVGAFEEADLRRSHWVASQNDNGKDIYFPHKYQQDKFDEPLTEYSMVLRLAEQYLIRAEARTMQDNLTGDNSAMSDINVIRERANLSNTTSATMEDLLNEINQERRIELMAEWGHRWLDLKRTKRAQEVMGTIVEKEFNSNDEYYPIPQAERDKNFQLGQNSGY